jgi:hypothetical protein
MTSIKVKTVKIKSTQKKVKIMHTLLLKGMGIIEHIGTLVDALSKQIPLATKVAQDS